MTTTRPTRRETTTPRWGRRTLAGAALAATTLAVVTPAAPVPAAAAPAAAQSGVSSNGPGVVPSWPGLSCGAFNADGWGVCTTLRNGTLPFYEYRPSALVKAFDVANFPHGSLHAASTLVSPGVWRQGDRLGAPVRAGTGFFAWRAPGGLRCLSGVRFLLNPFIPGLRVNTGFPGAYSLNPSNPMDPRYSRSGPGNEWTYTQQQAFLRAEPACNK